METVRPRKDEYRAVQLSEATVGEVLRPGEADHRTELGQLFAITIRTSSGTAMARLGEWIVFLPPSGDRVVLNDAAFKQQFVIVADDAKTPTHRSRRHTA